MAELADALDLGSSGRPCRFDSCYPHEIRILRHDECLEILIFLRLGYFCFHYCIRYLDCANCSKKIEEKITSNPDYKDGIVNFSTVNEFNDETVSFILPSEMMDEITEVGLVFHIFKCIS